MAKNYALLPDAVKMYTQTETLKEVKDMSKNLVSGEFEREYRSGVLEKSGRRKQTCLAALGVAVAGLTGWLLVLTVVREVQLAGLRRDVDQLTANMIAMTANVKSLNQKISSNRLFNEFKNLEDTMYAEDEDDTIPVDGKSDKESESSLVKLDGLTTLEDEHDIGDDDMYDDDDEDDDDGESGDYYTEYEKGNDKPGTLDKVKFKSDEFLGSVVTLGKEKQKASIIREIKRLLNENPENPDITFPPIAASQLSDHTSSSDVREKRSISSEATAEEIDPFSPPSAVAKSEFTRKSKKYDPSKDTMAVKVHGVSRIARNSEDEGERRPFIAAHFHGDTSQLSPATHKHYKGNGMVMMPHEVAHNVWSAAAWTRASPHRVPTVNKHGRIEVYHTGIYFVYVQIYYLDRHDIISWVLHRTNSDLDGRDTLLQCAQSSHSADQDERPNSCFSAAALFLKAGDRLAVRNTGGDRHSLMQPEKSFIGLVKLADAVDPDE